MNIVEPRWLICPRLLPALRDNRAWARMPEEKMPEEKVPEEKRSRVHYRDFITGPCPALDWLSGCRSELKWPATHARPHGNRRDVR